MSNKTLREGLIEISKKYQEELIDRLEKDGRKASKNLINSVNFVANEIFFGFESVFSYLFYGSYFETGIPASKIKPAGKAKIEGLLDWIRRKGLSEGLDKDKQFAFAISKKHEQKGFPLFGPINFQTRVLDELQPFLEKEIQKLSETAIRAELTDLVNDLSKFSKFITNGN